MVYISAYKIKNLATEFFKCFHGMNPMYLNNLFCKQEIKYDLRDKTLLEQLKISTKTWLQVVQILWIKIMECSSFWNKELGKLWWIQIKINYLVPFKRSWQTWNILTFLFSLFWLNCHCYPNWRGSCGQHGAHLGSVGPSWARVGPVKFAIRDCYHYRHHHYYHHYYDGTSSFIIYKTA